MVDNFLFDRIFSAESLYYSWNDLKIKKYSSYDFDNFKFSEPVPVNWFFRTSKLILNNKFKYKKKNDFLVDNSARKLKVLNKIKLSIIENAFLIGLKNKLSFNLNASCLTKYVRFFDKCV